MLKFLLYLILFFVLVRLIARFFIGRFIAKHMPPPGSHPFGHAPKQPGTPPLDRIKDAEFEDVTDSN
jgi:hypothetical protein